MTKVSLRAYVHKLPFAYFDDKEKSPSAKIIRMYLTDKPYKQLYLKLIWQFMLFILTTSISASIHQAIEHNSQPRTTSFNVGEMREILMRNFSTTYNVSLDAVNELVSGVREVDIIETMRPKDGDMRYLEAFVLTLSTFYTIGWGHVTPPTNGGKVFCIFSALIGIPVTMMFVLTSTKILIRHVKDIIHSTQTSYTGVPNEYGDTKNNKRTRQLLFPALLIVLLVYWFVSSIAVMKMKKCSYVPALYYSFTTFTTIGFSDYAINNSMLEGSWLRVCTLTIFCFIWVWFGVVLVSANVLTVMLVNVKTLNLKKRKKNQNIEKSVTYVSPQPQECKCSLRDEHLDNEH